MCFMCWFSSTKIEVILQTEVKTELHCRIWCLFISQINFKLKRPEMVKKTEWGEKRKKKKNCKPKRWNRRANWINCPKSKGWVPGHSMGLYEQVSAPSRAVSMSLRAAGWGWEDRTRVLLPHESVFQYRKQEKWLTKRCFVALGAAHALGGLWGDGEKIFRHAGQCGGAVGCRSDALGHYTAWYPMQLLTSCELLAESTQQTSCERVALPQHLKTHHLIADTTKRDCYCLSPCSKQSQAINK